MKSKNPKIQIFKKGIATFMSAMLLVTPLAYATTSLDDSYLESSLWDKILYGTIGSTVKEIEEHLTSHTTLYITNEIQLRAFAEYVNNGNDCSGKEIILLNDIELNRNEEWVPIKSFNGIFDGNNYTISGLRYTSENRVLEEELNNIGFFKTISENGIVKNLILEDVCINLISEDDYSDRLLSETYGLKVGAVAGINSGKIKNCLVSSGKVAGNIRVGGIAGELFGEYAQVERSENRGMVQGKEYVGGIVGMANGYISIHKCKNSGIVEGESKIGGILGYNSQEGYATQNINYGEVEGSSYIGGIVGDNANYVSECLNHGLIQGEELIGGIIGHNGHGADIENCINFATIIGDEKVGGIAGENTSLIKKCKNEGDVIGNSDVDGIAGVNSGDIDCNENDDIEVSEEEIGPGTNNSNQDTTEDTEVPTVETEVYVENALETNRYTAGKDIIIKVKTTEPIEGDYNRPELEISFTESGVGKYNYNGENAGLAKCIDAKIDLEGKTTWTYVYQIQELDEGKIQVKCVEGELKDLAGNINNLANNNLKVESDIYADTTAPTVQIMPLNVKNNITNSDTLLYVIQFSEEIEGLSFDDITVNNGEKRKVTVGDVSKLYNYINNNQYNSMYDIDGNGEINETDKELLYQKVQKEPKDILGIKDKYIYMIPISVSIPEGSTGEVQVIIEQNAVQDKVGLGNIRQESIIVVDKRAPILINLEAYATSELALNKDIDVVKEYYKENDKITVIATFDENIVAEEIPELSLQFSESGNAKGTVSGVVGGNKLVYTYTISSGDQGKLSVKGFTGIVKDAIGNETVVAKRTLEGDTIIADTNVPSLQELNIVTEEGTYKAGTTIEVHAIYDENAYGLKDNEIKNITSETAPTLKVKFGNGEERETEFKGYVGEDKSKLKYTISIVDGDNGELSLTSYTNKENVKVCDIAGNESSLGVNPTGNEIIADTIRPEVTNIVATVENPSISGTDIYYKEGNKIKITLTFSEEVSGAVLFPKIQVGFSEEKGIEPIEYNTYAYESDWNVNSKTIEYSYTIRNGENGYLWVKVPEGQFKDVAGNSNVSRQGEEKLNVFADTTIPTVTLYKDTEETQNKQTIKIKATFNENIYDLNGNTRIILTNANAPKLIYSFGEGANRETKDSEASVKGNTITYTITKDPVGDNGDLHYELAKGNLCDRAGNELYKTTLDTTAPVLENVLITSNAGIYAPYCSEGKEIYVIATFNEPIKAENMKLKAKVGDKEISELTGEIFELDPTRVIFKYEVQAGDMGVLKILDICGETDSKITEENADKTYGWVRDEYGNQNNIYSFADEGVTPIGGAEADTKDPYITSIKAIADDKEIATYSKEDGKDAVITVGRTNANIVEYIVTYSEKVQNLDKSKISITNGIIKSIEYNNLVLNEYKITVQTNYEGVQSLIINEATVEDKAGNTDEFVRLNAVTVDFTMPTVRFISEYNGGVYVLPTNIGKVEIRPNVEISEDISKIEYKWDNGEYVEINNYSSSSDISVPSKAFTEYGQYKLFIKVTDLAGNVAETSKTYKVVYSNIEIDVDKTDYTNQDVTATVSYGEGLTDNRKVTFKPEGSNELIEVDAKGTNAKGTEYTIWTNGTIYVEATDRIGNKVFTEHTVYNIDKEKPEVELSLNGANLVIGTGKEKATMATTVYVNEPVTIQYAWYAEVGPGEGITGKVETSASDITSLELNNQGIQGKWYLKIIATDKAGNVTELTSAPFTVVDTNERGEEENKVAAEKPVSELIIFEQMKEDEKDKAYVYVNYDYSIIEDLEITLADESYGYVGEYNSVELYGNTTIHVKAWDACGNEVTHTCPVTDIVGPEFTIIGNPENWTNGDVSLEIQSKAPLKTLTKNGENILGDNQYIVNTVIDTYGNYTFEATDIYNNTSKQDVEVKIDKSAPEITDVKIENGVIVITANDIDKTLNKELSGLAEYAITDTTEVPQEWSQSNEIRVTKDENFFVWAKDNAGNIYMKEQIVARDITAPELTITTDVSLDKWTNTNIKVSVESNEELSSLNIELIDNISESATVTDILRTKSYTIELNGTYEIRAKDKSGNETKERIEVTKIDKFAPEISSAVANGKDITITASDDLSGIVGYAITSTTEEPVEWSKESTIKVTEDGTFYVWVKDNAENVKMKPETIVVDTTAPTITFNYLSQTVTVGMPLEAYILTNEEATISYSWDNKAWATTQEFITSLRVNEKATTPGTYTLYAKVTDKAGNESAIQTLEFTVTNMEEIKQPEIVFEDIPTIQINGTRYVKVSSDMTKEGLTDKMNGEALCGKTPEYTKLTEDGKLKTGSEIAINGSTKYVIVVNGDVNCDGKIDFLGDIILANDYRIGIGTLSTIQRLAADINNDGKVDFISDILAINDYRIGITKSL